MNFLTSLVNRLLGKKDNDQTQTAQVTAPRSPAPVAVAPALAVQKVAPVQTVAVAPAAHTPDIQPVSLVKAQPQAPAPEPGLLQKAAASIGNVIDHPVNAAKSVASAITNAPMVQGFAHEISAPFVEGTYQKANEESQAKNDAVDAQVLAAAKKQADPAKKAHLISLLKNQPQKLDYNDISGLNDTTEQVLGNAGGVALDALGLPSLVSSLIPGAIKAGAGELAADSLVKATAKNAALGGLYGADSAAHDNVTDPGQFAAQTGIGAAFGGGLSLAGSALGKVVSKLRGAPAAAEKALVPEAEAAAPKFEASVPDSVTAPTPIAKEVPAPVQLKKAPIAAAEPVAAPIRASGSPTLPKELAGAKPSYKSFQPKFASDVDKAAYIVGGKGQSASHQAYQDWLENAVGMSKSDIRALGSQVRDSIKESSSKLADGEKLVVPPHYPAVPFHPEAPVVATPEAPAGQTFFHSTTGDLDSIRAKGLIGSGENSGGGMGTSGNVFGFPEEKLGDIYSKNENGQLLRVNVPPDQIKNVYQRTDGTTVYRGTVDPSWLETKASGEWKPLVEPAGAPVAPVAAPGDAAGPVTRYRITNKNGDMLYDNGTPDLPALKEGQFAESYQVGPNGEALNEQPFNPSAAAPEGKTVAEISDAGATRNSAQIEMESRLRSGDIAGVQKIVDALPDSDPYKASMQSLLDVTPKLPGDTVPEPRAPKPAAAVKKVKVSEDVKAPRQAQILVDKEMSTADRAEMSAKLPKASPASLDAAQARATARTAALGDEAGVAKAYANEPALDNPEDYYSALEAAKRLSGLTDDASKLARSNIYNAMLEYSSKAGLNLRSTQVLWGDMPVELKVSTMMRSLQKSVAKRFGPDSAQVLELSDPAKRAAIEGRFKGLFDVDQSIRDRESVQQGLLADAKENTGSYSKEQIKEAGKALLAAREELSKNAGDFAKFWDEKVPSNAKFMDKVGDAQRVAMLSSLTGRVRDLIQTPLIGSQEVASSKLSGLIGRVLNKATGQEGKFVDRGLGYTDLVKAIPSALKKAGQNLREGDTYATIENVRKSIAQTPDRTDLSGATRGFGSRLTKAGTNLANDAVEGLKTGEVGRLLRQQGQKEGLAGADLEKYVLAGSYDPPADILAKGQHLQDVVNNVNKNPISDALRGVNEAVGKIPVVGKFIKNALDPFPTWLGGNIWNTITDRNVIANTVKFIANIKKDPQMAVDQLSKALVGTGDLYAAGYLLSKSGLISDKDANGDSYQGSYFHIGNRFIPVSNAGAISANIILGHTLYQAMNSDDPVGGVVNGMKSLYNSLNIDNVGGGNSYFTKALTQFGQDPTQAAATAISGVGGQFIPAIGGDVNAILNNSPLNPGHEAADTKVEDPNSATGHATDFLKTAEAQLENKVPGLSQTLPRREGQASQDLLDRVTQGNHTSDEQVQQAADDKAQASEALKGLTDQGAFTPKMRSILDSDTQKIYDRLQKDGTVPAADLKKLTSGLTKGTSATADSRFLEDGDYDSNLSALKIKRSLLAQDPTTTEKELGEYDTQIKRGEVYKKDAVPYPLISQYAKTSLSEWRELGNPKSDTYDPAEYQKLYDLDTALTDAGASRNANDQTQHLYLAKKASTGSGSADSAATTKAKSNKIGSVANLTPVSLAKISGHATGTPGIQTIAPIRAENLVKKRKISVS